MKRLHELITKKWWFILFNFASLSALALTGRFSSGTSAISSLLALLLMNGIAAISAQNFPDWK